VASQKFTCPEVTAVPPSFTAAVSVTTLPEATVVTGAPEAVTTRVVSVAVVLFGAVTVTELDPDALL
jgi:hypothetical protein